MNVDVTVPHINRDLLAALAAMDAAVQEEHTRARAMPPAEARYRMAKALAFLGCTGKTVAEREARAESFVPFPEEGPDTLNQIRQERDSAVALLRSAEDALRSAQVRVTAFQSMGRIVRAEAELARYGPGDAA